MAGIRHDTQLGFRPGAMQLPGAPRRAHYVIAALHDQRRDVADAADFLDELVLRAEESAVDEIVTLDAREGCGVGVLLEAGDVLGIHAQKAGCALPDRPRLGRAPENLVVIAGEARVVGADHVAALGLWNRLDVVLPKVGIERGRAAGVLVEPGELPAP